ncbi:HK97 gp10 family phage protein [Bacillus sp. J14TS2]|uniref:HK97 gp10 family phage protein n=1 Tax=Bacillus sp. J14TS2 TaxID=2807188 RepID=UPI001BB3C28A|nr:HK97 gp10 family phage protein [Bacillus sp. J14TS2]
MDIEGLPEFIKSLDKAINGGLEEQIGLWMEAMGMEFLDIVQDEIIRTETVDTRRLLNSFNKGDEDNIWSISSGGLTLDIGTNVKYASYVNDGHFTVNPNSGKDRRWVPGRWKGERFEHDPNERDSGMLLAIKWVDGTGYWDNALTIFERVFEKGLDKKLQEWLDTAF